jgi:dienelactone hydrolase
VHIEDIAYDVDGVQMIGHLATDDTRPGRRPAVLVCHEGPGLDEHAKRRAEMLAELGTSRSRSTTTAVASRCRSNR